MEENYLAISASIFLGVSCFLFKKHGIENLENKREIPLEALLSVQMLLFETMKKFFKESCVNSIRLYSFKLTKQKVFKIFERNSFERITQANFNLTLKAFASELAFKVWELNQELKNVKLGFIKGIFFCFKFNLKGSNSL
jgi:hypothetical protein